MIIFDFQGASGTGPARAGTHSTAQSGGVSSTPATAATPPAPPSLPETPIPPGGSRVTVQEDGDRTTYTTSALPPELMPLARMAQETAFGLMGLLAAIIILGPFARVFARRMQTRSDAKFATQAPNSQLLQQQLQQLQQSVDTMSIEIERISESQRFQNKLLFEKKD